MRRCPHPIIVRSCAIFAYGVSTLHMSRDFILIAVLVASCLSFVSIPLSGHISDRIGRRKMYLIGAATVGVFGFLYFAMVDTAIPSLVFIAIVLSLIPHDMQYGPQAALIAEAFTPRLRLQRCVTGLSVRLRDCRRSGAPDRDSPVRRLSHRLRDFPLHCRLCGNKPCGGVVHA